MDVDRTYRRQSVDVEKRLDSGGGGDNLLTKSDPQQDPHLYDIVKATQVKKTDFSISIIRSKFLIIRVAFNFNSLECTLAVSSY